VFLGAWQLIERQVPDVAARLDLMAVQNEYQVLLWPSSVLLLASPAETLSVGLLLAASAANGLLYAAIGMTVLASSRRPALLVAEASILLVGVWLLGRYWSASMTAIAVVAMLVVMLIVAAHVTRSLGDRPREAQRSSLEDR
jgi:hypothetical protein